MKKEILKLCENVDKSVESQSIFQHKKSFFKKLGVSILACFMFCMPLFAGCSSLCQGGSAASPTPSDPLGDIAPNYAPSYLGLDPETDKTIFTTESGLEIKFGGANLSSGALKGYAYFTMGSYNGYAVNWVIIARHSGISSGFGPNITEQIFKDFLNNSSATSLGTYLETETPAGADIYKDAHNGAFLLRDILNFAGVATLDNFLNVGEVYCISECVLISLYFYDGPIAGTMTYSGSDIQDFCLDISNRLDLSVKEVAMVIPKTIVLTDCNATNISLSNQSFYIPAVRNASDKIQNLLTTNALRIAYQIGTTSAVKYCTRDNPDGSNGYCRSIGVNGDYESYTGQMVKNNWVRPCCVVKLA